MFQYKILNGILFLNKLLFKFRKVPTPLCSFCNFVDETPLHIFYTSNITKRLWNELQYFVFQYHCIPEITPHSTLLGSFNIGNQQQNFLLINHLLLIFKHYLCMSREHGAACFTSLKLYLIKIKKIEQNISPCSSQKKKKCRRKWRAIENNKYTIRIFTIVLFLFLSIKNLLLIVILSTFFSGEKFLSWYYIMKLSFKLRYLYIINTDDCIT